MGSKILEVDKKPKDVLLLPSLLLGCFLASTITVFSSTLLVDIADSFNVSIGLASQLALISSLTGLVMGFAMGALTIKFKHKTLFLSGILLFAAGTLGFFLAQNFVTVLLSQFLIGIGIAIIGIMTYALIGEHFSLEKRGWAIGLTVSVPTAAFIIVGPLSGIISNIAGWRSVLLWFILPFSVVCLILSLIAIPKLPQPHHLAKPLYSKPFKAILLNKSAMACALATALFTIISVVPFYAVSFYRIAFAIPPTMGALFSSVAAAGGMLGGIVGGKLINKCGRKPLTIIASIISGASVILFSYIYNLWVSVAFWTVAAATSAIAVTALFSLVIEQVPSFRASMMSINSAFHNTGIIVGVLIGGLVLTLQHNNFQLLMVIFGSLGAIAAPIILFLAADPTKKDST